MKTTMTLVAALAMAGCCPAAVPPKQEEDIRLLQKHIKELEAWAKQQQDAERKLLEAMVKEGEGELGRRRKGGYYEWLAGKAVHDAMVNNLVTVSAIVRSAEDIRYDAAALFSFNGVGSRRSRYSRDVIEAVEEETVAGVLEDRDAPGLPGKKTRGIRIGGESHWLLFSESAFPKDRPPTAGMKTGDAVSATGFRGMFGGEKTFTATRIVEKGTTKEEGTGRGHEDTPGGVHPG